MVDAEQSGPLGALRTLSSSSRVGFLGGSTSVRITDEALEQIVPVLK